MSNQSPLATEDVVFRADTSLLAANPNPVWDMGDGTFLTGTVVIHRYMAEGRYRVVLTAREKRCGVRVTSNSVFVHVEPYDTACPRDPDPLTCGNGHCDRCEYLNCPGDCPIGCGDARCDEAAGESCATCDIDCAYRPTFTFAPPSPVMSLQTVEFHAEPALIDDPNPKWDAGDGAHGSGLSFLHAYEQPGEYHPVLTATEAKCHSTQKSRKRRIDVLAPQTHEGNHATVVSQNLPSCLAPGATYDVTIIMQNTGTTGWAVGAGFRLGAVDHKDPFTSQIRVPITRPVGPLEMYPFEFVLTAPPTEQVDALLTDWRMIQEGVGWFGDASARQFVVVADSCSMAVGVSYGCEALVHTSEGIPVPNQEILLQAYALDDDAPPRLIGNTFGFTDTHGQERLDLEVAEPAQRIVCQAAGVRATTPSQKVAADPIMVPDGKMLELDLTLVRDWEPEAEFDGLKPGRAIARLYQSLRYDKPVVIPPGFKPDEQQYPYTEGNIYKIYKDGGLMPALYDAGYDVWLIRTKTGQNIHEQAAETAQAIDYVASTSPTGKVIVIGYSLGGLTARLATARWQADAEWRASLGVRDVLPVSAIVFGDAPLKGAHINLCLQTGLWSISAPLSPPAPSIPLPASEANLNSCGAQQMLRESVSSQMPSLDLPIDANWRAFYENGEAVRFGRDGVCDRYETAWYRSRGTMVQMPACVCDAGPAVFSVNGDGFPHGPVLLAFSNGNSGPQMCYGDERDLDRNSERVCLGPIPFDPGAADPRDQWAMTTEFPHEMQLGDPLYKIHYPLEKPDPLCRAEAEDLEGGGRLGGDVTRTQAMGPIKGGVEQYQNPVFIPISSSLPSDAPFDGRVENEYQGVHGKGDRFFIDWVLERLGEVNP